MPGLSSSHVQRWLRPFSGSLGRIWFSTSRMSASGRRHVALRELQSGTRTTARARFPSRPRPIRDSPNHVRVHGGKSRYRAFRPSSTGACERGSRAELVDLSQTKDNGSGSLENPNGNSGAAELLQPRGGLRIVRVPSAVQQHDELVFDLPFGRGRRSCPKCPQSSMRGRRMAGSRDQFDLSVKRSRSRTRRHAVRRLGIQQDFRGANNYRRISSVRLFRSERTLRGMDGAGVVIPTDPSRRSATRRATTSAAPTCIRWTSWRGSGFRCRGPPARRSSASKPSIC